jgi:aspartyl-tRNA(Asn)/glutamyl-tRNA(Gln) amidotransferase subunit C
MKISQNEVRRGAALARLGFTPDEEQVLTEQLNQILEYMDKLGRLDTSQVEPLAHVVDVVNAFREDKVVNRSATEALLANAPAREKNFFKVPKIIE